VDKDVLKLMIAELNEKNTVIRGYAQLALKCDHPRWTKRYIASIIQQVDRITALNRIITDLYLSNTDNNNDSDNYSSSGSAMLDSLISRHTNFKFH
jgi:hypothetical protein